MPVFRLGRDLTFPPARLARPEGLLAYGGDLSPARLLAAYRAGIFPWYDPGEPILWWSPDPRMVLDPSAMIVSRSLRSTIRKGTFEVRFDTAFEAVVRSCSRIRRKHEDGTWIGPEIIEAYTRLHAIGYAHSAEAWAGGELVGGLYGLELGSIFCGESMFARRPDASKVALEALSRRLVARGTTLIDCQVPSDHLRSLGAVEMRRAAFLDRLATAVRSPDRPGSWAD